MHREVEARTKTYRQVFPIEWVHCSSCWAWSINWGRSALAKHLKNKWSLVRDWDRCAVPSESKEGHPKGVLSYEVRVWKSCSILYVHIIIHFLTTEIMLIFASASSLWRCLQELEVIAVLQLSYFPQYFFKRKVQWCKFSLGKAQRALFADLISTPGYRGHAPIRSAPQLPLRSVRINCWVLLGQLEMSSPRFLGQEIAQISINKGTFRILMRGRCSWLIHKTQ